MSDDYEGNLPTVKTVFRAQSIAGELGHEYVTLEHLLASLIEQEDVIELLTKLKIDVSEIKTDIEEYLSTDAFPVTNSQPRPTELFDEVVHMAVASAIMSSRKKPKAVDLLLHMMQTPHEDSFAVTLLLKMGLSALSIKKALSHNGGASTDKRRPVHEMGEASQAAPISTREEAEALIEQFALNLNKQALESKIDPLIGRSKEITSIIQIVARRTKNNVILVGEPGVGKTAIAEGLALKIARKEVPEVIAESTVYSLDISSVVAGTRFRGDFEERMKQILKALEMIPGSILFIDEIHTVMGAGAGSNGSLDVANILKPALAKGTLRCMGSTTLEEYRKHFEKDRALLRRFKRVDIHEPSIEDSKLILRGLAPYYEEFHNVKFLPEALDSAVELTARYVTNNHLPDKAIDVIDNAGSCQRVAPAETRKTEIGLKEIEEEVAKVAHIPAQTVAEDESEKLVRLEGELQKNVVGQNKALLELTDAVYMSRAGLKEINKPAGCYLFTGPTGVGKTEAAKTLATTLGIPLIKYDMSEYMEKHSVSKLIGSPPGYVGYAEGNAGGGKLINDIDSHPHCVLLLDEIEKAHPDIFNVLLQVMDDAKLTSAAGKTVHFRNVILIMTSNAGASELEKNPIGFSKQEVNDADDPVIKRMFTPEFRNRLDANVKFTNLKPEHMLVIVDKFIQQLSSMTADRNVTLEVDQEAKKWLADKGYDRQMGARPLQRVITENIRKPLSRLMVSGSLSKGGTAFVRVEDEKILVSA